MATSHAFIVSYTLMKRICNALYKKHTYFYFLFFSSNLSDPYSSLCCQVTDQHATAHALLKRFVEPYCISRPLSISLKGLRSAIIRGLIGCYRGLRGRCRSMSGFIRGMRDGNTNIIIYFTWKTLRQPSLDIQNYAPICRYRVSPWTTHLEEWSLNFWMKNRRK